MIRESEFVGRTVEDFIRLVEEGHIKLKFTTRHDHVTEASVERMRGGWQYDIKNLNQHEHGEIIERIVYPAKINDSRNRCGLEYQEDSENHCYGKRGTKENPVTVIFGF
tara:strand:+ start:331 stop:657 length:327 start_codon:yes stop_codon:yes gene_type:complete